MSISVKDGHEVGDRYSFLNFSMIAGDGRKQRVDGLYSD